MPCGKVLVQLKQKKRCCVVLWCHRCTKRKWRTVGGIRDPALRFGVLDSCAFQRQVSGRVSVEVRNPSERIQCCA